MRATETSGVILSAGEYLCPDCTTPYPSAYAAAACDCGED